MTRIWTVDAFTDLPYAGNPAAVMIVDQFPKDDLCQKIAAEMNLSETAFVKPLGQDHFHLRWFTPTVEVLLCGHATLATAHVLFEQKKTLGNKIQFDSLSGPLSVTQHETGLTLDFPLQKIEKSVPKEPFQDLLNVPILNAVQAGEDIIVELECGETVRNLTVNFSAIEAMPLRDLIITAKGNDKFDFISRVFAPKCGINEDPVTGSAHCKLVDYWQKKLDKKCFLAYQASQRGGSLKITIIEDRVHLSGQAITILEGKWLQPITKEI